MILEDGILVDEGRGCFLEDPRCYKVRVWMSSMDGMVESKMAWVEGASNDLGGRERVFKKKKKEN